MGGVAIVTPPFLIRMFLTPEIIRSDMMKVFIMAHLVAQRKARLKANQVRYNLTGKSRARHERFAEAHPERIKAKQDKYNQSAKSKARFERYNRTEKSKARHRRFRKTEKGKALKVICRQRYNEKNREAILKRERARGKRFYATVRGRLISHARGRIRLAMCVAKQSMPASASKMIGCGWAELKRHLESQFTPEMNWENYASFWEMDHVKPIASFDLSDPAQVAECFSWRNIQPLTVVHNRRKSSKLDYQPTPL